MDTKTRLAMAVILAMVLSSLGVLGCGSAPPLTDEIMQRMNDQDAMALLECQTEKVYDDIGEQAGTRYIWGKAFGQAQTENTTVQQVLWADGYVCREWGSNWRIE